MIGVTMSLTNALSTAANATPITNATASSIRFPFIRKSLNSCNIEAPPSAVVDQSGWIAERAHRRVGVGPEVAHAPAERLPLDGTVGQIDLEHAALLAVARSLGLDRALAHDLLQLSRVHAELVCPLHGGGRRGGTRGRRARCRARS